jgi:hypothetical protein
MDVASLKFRGSLTSPFGLVRRRNFLTLGSSRFFGKSFRMQEEYDEFKD